MGAKKVFTCFISVLPALFPILFKDCQNLFIRENSTMLPDVKGGRSVFAQFCLLSYEVKGSFDLPQEKEEILGL